MTKELESGPMDIKPLTAALTNSVREPSEVLRPIPANEVATMYGHKDNVGYAELRVWINTWEQGLTPMVNLPTERTGETLVLATTQEIFEEERRIAAFDREQRERKKGFNPKPTPNSSLGISAPGNFLRSKWPDFTNLERREAMVIFDDDKGEFLDPTGVISEVHGFAQNNDGYIDTHKKRDDWDGMAEQAQAELIARREERNRNLHS